MMGFRLNIATEAPTKDNDSMYMFNKDFILVEGGAWESDIFDILDENSKDINWTKAECKTYPECFMCDCSDHTWTKINVEDLNGKDKQLKNNCNIAFAFLTNEIPDEDYETMEYCSYDYIVNHKHRDYIWFNIC